MKFSRNIWLILPLSLTVGCVQQYIDPCISDSDNYDNACSGGSTGSTTTGVEPSTSGVPTTTEPATTSPTTEPVTTDDATTSSTDPTSDSESSETVATTDSELCTEDPAICVHEDLSGERCKVSPSDGCYRCADSEGGCSPCEEVTECLGTCTDGFCGAAPCYLEADGADSCSGNLSCNSSGSCDLPQTCAELYDWGYRENGLYWIDVDGAGNVEPFEAECDMSRTCSGASGGWTKLTIQDVVTKLGASDVGMGFECQEALCCETQNIEGNASPTDWVVAPEVSPDYGPHARHRSWIDNDVVGHTCQYTFRFPFTEFAFEGYGPGGSCPGDLCAIDTIDMIGWDKVWKDSNSTTGHGDILFGTPVESAVTSVADIRGMLECFGGDGLTPTGCTDIEGVELDTITTPPNNCYEVAMESDQFQIAWGEFGKEAEGVAPWFTGKILLR